MATKKKTELEEVAEAVNTEPEGVAEQPLNAVIVVRVDEPDGGLGTRVAVNGDVRPSEVETLLGLGLKGWREQLGLDA